MTKSDWVGHILSTAVVLVGLLTIGATIWLTLYMAGRGPIPPKQLSADFIGPIDPLKDLQDTGTNISVSVSNGKQPVQKLYIYRASLENTGDAPILPSDFFSDIKLTALPDWRIIAVGNSPWRGSQNVSVVWKRVSDNLYTGSPTLLNSGDEVSVGVYLTASEDVAKAAIFRRDAAPISFDARVANLPSITVKPDFLTRTLPGGGGIMVNIRGWGVWFFLVIFGLYFALHLFLLKRLVTSTNVRYALFLIFIASISSVSAAEATTTYVFGPYAGLVDVAADGWVNIPPLAINFGLLLYFYLVPILMPQTIRSRS
ncbi:MULTISPECIES: hypothetical protein [unclassified Rhizobium]|uniref:hypothetical protein n=1 Tax=unclassified Rhizobium TaxID=2613769 RepID=UPI00381F2413